MPLSVMLTDNYSQNGSHQAPVLLWADWRPEQGVTKAGSVWAGSSDTKRPLSPSSGLFCLLHCVTISHFIEMKAEEPSCHVRQGLLWWVCPCALTNLKGSNLTLKKSLLWG